MNKAEIPGWLYSLIVRILSLMKSLFRLIPATNCIPGVSHPNLKGIYSRFSVYNAGLPV